MVLLLLACAADPEPTPTELALALAEPGPYGVSYSTRTLLWDSPLGPRELHLASWAPSPAPNSGLDYRDLVESAGASKDSTLAEGRFPLAVFSHGHQGYAEVSAFLMEHLASHGFVVLAPDHTGNTLFDGPDRQTSIYWQRPMDLSAALDWAEAPGDDALAGHIGEGVVVLGHSFGGYTVHALAGAVYSEARLAACAGEGDGTPFCDGFTPADAAIFAEGLGDDRVQAVASLAPGDFALFGAEGLGAIGAPVLHALGSADAGGDALDIWEALNRAGNLLLWLEGAGHQAFTDFAGNLEPEATLEPAEGWRLIRAYTLAWALQGLGDPRGTPLLTGEVTLGDAAVLTPGG